MTPRGIGHIPGSTAATVCCALKTRTVTGQILLKLMCFLCIGVDRGNSSVHQLISVDLNIWSRQMGCCAAAGASALLLCHRTPALQGHQLFRAFAVLLSERDHLDGHCTGGRGRPDRACSTECTWAPVSCHWRGDRQGCPADIQTSAAQSLLAAPLLLRTALSGSPLRSPLCRSFWIWAWL